MEQSIEQIQQLKKFIFSSIQSGITTEEITQQLRSSGWDDVTINKAFAEVRASLKPAPTINPAAAVSQTSTTPGGQVTASGQKRGRLKTSWILFTQSLKIIKNNKELYRYISQTLIWNLLITMIYLPIVFFGRNIFLVATTTSDGLNSSTNYTETPAGMALSLSYYILTFFIVFIYSAGLTAHTLDIFRGKSEHYKHYMKIAWSKSFTIFIYTLITTTVGLILRAIEQRSKLLGRIIARLLGSVWSLANLFTIPVIVESDVSAPKAIKESSQLFISRWGENIAARLTFGGVGMLIYLVIFIPAIFISIFLLSIAFSTIGLLIFIISLLLSHILFSIVINTASNVLSVALYYYAKYQQIPAVYDQDLLNSVFIQKQPKRGLFSKKAA